MTESSWQNNSLMFGQSLVSENNLRLNSMSAQLGKYLMVTACGRVEPGSIPPGNAPYIFVIPANAGRVGRLGRACQWLRPSRSVVETSTVDRHKNKTGIFALGRDEGPGFGGERTHGASSHKPPP